jgi:hypothetical protein
MRCARFKYIRPTLGPYYQAAAVDFYKAMILFEHRRLEIVGIRASISPCHVSVVFCPCVPPTELTCSEHADRWATAPATSFMHLAANQSVIRRF